MNRSLKSPSPIGLLLLSILSVQFGSALAKSLFDDLGPWGVVFLRVAFSALILFAVGRPRFNATVRQNFTAILTYGIVLTTMNSLFYAAIDRIPLGIAISLEFTGPLGLSVLKSQRWLDSLWAVLALAGIVLLTPITGAALDPLGMVFALAAGLCWAIYIVLAVKVGSVLPGVEGLTWGLLVGTVMLLPIGVITTGSALLNPRLLGLGAGVALLSSMLPYSLEMVALRSLPIRVFGVMLSLEPMAGVVAGFLILGETLSARSLLACLLVSIAAGGAAQFQSAPPPPLPPAQ
ncbi:DMT family transporter [cf. Phormidesmis sp. LEGE 11477]|uniref:EamA family transporter n=1 Tax=cf. Phormidesmis sp. LEGE 11477 TaxID=1828680 RepID=UPI0018811139|nr:EamA family transporter [cf. Phormidesmis sp. LEGE 11477]MBE9062363.1 EamA family transporter [cf. Phormidesmis sp. LEGE 11477]